MSAAHSATQALGPRASAGAGAGRPPGTLSGACSDSGDRSREVGAGCGHAVATQTPRPWEVQAGAARPLLSGLRPPQAGHVGAASALPGSLHEGPQRPLLHLLFPLETTHPQPAQCLPSGTFHRRLLLSPPDLPPDSHPPPAPTCVQARLRPGRGAVGPRQPRRRARRDFLWF